MHGPKKAFNKPCDVCDKNAWREIYSGTERALGRQCTGCNNFIAYAPADAEK